MKKPVIALYSLGCVKNLIDSEQALAQLGMAGTTFTSDPRDADCAIVNTCTFVRDADAESREAIREAARAKKDGRCRWLFVVGCMGARYGKSLLAEFPEVDAVYGVLDSATVMRILERVAGRGRASPRESVPPRLRLTPRHYAYLRIAEGCDNRCSYCVIPTVRGALTSRPIDQIILEARHLADDGAREIIVVAQDITNFGVDRAGRRMLPELLNRLVEVEKVRWIRLLYMHPAHVDDAVIDTIASHGKILRYVDLPLQHVSDAVLERMGRKVDSAAIRRLVETIRRRVQGVVMRTTFIVGFPGERDEDYEALERAVRELRFDRLGVFAYSPEQGTPAAGMPAQVPQDVRSARRDRLLRVQQEIAFERNRAMVGRTLEVLVDDVDKDGVRIGRSYGEAPDADPVILISGSNASPGDFVQARISNARGYDLAAESVGGGGA
ncbi:MAG: 30S ribosomal protein S12 methylthiotransferase RimO [Planctomycetota bacterium]